MRVLDIFDAPVIELFLALAVLSIHALNVGEQGISIACCAYAAVVLDDLQVALRTRVRARLMRGALLPPQHSSWKAVEASNCDRSYLAWTGLDIASFLTVARAVEAKIPGRARGVRRGPGRKPGADARDITALALHYMISRGPDKDLQGKFGLTDTVVGIERKKGLLLVREVLREMPGVQIRWPAEAEMLVSATAILTKDPVPPAQFPSDIFPWAFVDGLFTRLQTPRDSAQMDDYYSGYKRMYGFNSILAFMANGLICFAQYGFPGHLNDQTTSYEFIHQLNKREEHPKGYYGIGDSANRLRRT